MGLLVQPPTNVMIFTETSLQLVPYWNNRRIGKFCFYSFSSFKMDGVFIAVIWRFILIATIGTVGVLFFSGC